jgi:hypothetical protein
VIPHRSVRQLEAYITDIDIQEEQQILIVFITRKEESDLELAKDLRQKGVITTPRELFQELQQQEINSLIIRGVFEFVQYDANIYKGQIFNLRLVNKVKGKSTKTLYEKLRLVI